jgi:predicted nucleic acid-binding protein
MYLLDSNVCIRLINNTSPTVTRRLATQQPEDIVVSTITQLELYYGAYRSVHWQRNLEILERFFIEERQRAGGRRQKGILFPDGSCFMPGNPSTALPPLCHDRRE